MRSFVLPRGYLERFDTTRSQIPSMYLVSSPVFPPAVAPNVHSIWPSVEANGYGDTLCVIDEHHRPPLKLTRAGPNNIFHTI